jgi:hypothetical protein
MGREGGPRRNLVLHGKGNGVRLGAKAPHAPVRRLDRTRPRFCSAAETCSILALRMERQTSAPSLPRTHSLRKCGTRAYAQVACDTFPPPLQGGVNEQAWRDHLIYYFGGCSRIVRQNTSTRDGSNAVPDCASITSSASLKGTGTAPGRSAVSSSNVWASETRRAK